jgi:hypothetical protein
MKPIAGAAAAFALAVTLSLAATQARAQPASGEDLTDRVISWPVPSAYRVDGVRNKPPVRSDKDVQGGKALRVEVPGKAANAWAVAVAVPIRKAVKSGDKLILAFWARLEKGENGATSTTLPYNAVQMSSAPYTALFAGPATIDSTWKLHQIEGRANANYPADTLNVSIQLATAKQTVDVGPVFVFDMGQ